MGMHLFRGLIQQHQLHLEMDNTHHQYIPTYGNYVNFQSRSKFYQTNNFISLGTIDHLTLLTLKVTGTGSTNTPFFFKYFNWVQHMCKYCTLLLQYWYSTCTIFFEQYFTPPPHKYLTVFPTIKSLQLHIIMSLFKPKDYSYKSHHKHPEGYDKSFSTVLPKQYCKSTSSPPWKRQFIRVSDFSKHGEESSRPAYSALLKDTAPKTSGVESSSESEKYSIYDHTEN